jgi:hypothetical protein
MNILYPEMKPVINYEERDKGETFGKGNRRIAGIHIRYYTEEKLSYLNNASKYIINNEIRKNYSLSNNSNNKLLGKYPSIKLYSYKNSDKYKGVYYVFTTEDGSIFTVSCVEEIPTHSCKVHGSWKGKFDITYYLPLRFFYDMVDFNQDVYDLVTGFNPTHSSDIRY